MLWKMAESIHNHYPCNNCISLILQLLLYVPAPITPFQVMKYETKMPPVSLKSNPHESLNGSFLYLGFENRILQSLKKCHRQLITPDQEI